MERYIQQMFSLSVNIELIWFWHSIAFMKNAAKPAANKQTSVVCVEILAMLLGKKSELPQRYNVEILCCQTFFLFGRFVYKIQCCWWMKW